MVSTEVKVGVGGKAGHGGPLRGQISGYRGWNLR